MQVCLTGLFSWCFFYLYFITICYLNMFSVDKNKNTLPMFSVFLQFSQCPPRQCISTRKIVFAQYCWCHKPPTNKLYYFFFFALVTSSFASLKATRICPLIVLFKNFGLVAFVASFTISKSAASISTLPPL